MGVGFFFKQKTAYELHISDWSSDVCSSDLRPWPSPRQRDRRRYRQRRDDLEIRVSPVEGASAGGAGVVYERQARRESDRAAPDDARAAAFPVGSGAAHALASAHGWKAELVHCAPARSEEHTSELQSLMRISYAVFCLKKKTKSNYTITR